MRLSLFIKQFLIFIAFPSLTYTQSLTINGTVTDQATNSMIGQVNISITGYNETATTDNDGVFFLKLNKSIHKGEAIILRYNKSGYSVRTKNIIVSQELPVGSIQLIRDRPISSRRKPVQERDYDSNERIATIGNSECRIDSIRGEGSNDQLFWRFKYDLKTKKLIEIRPNINSTGSPNLIFVYNKDGQLIEYKGKFNNGAWLFRHRYGYGDGLIKYDTMYLNFTGSPVQYSELQYDYFKRIVREIRTIKGLGNRDSMLPDTTINYKYNDEGNLIKDDKKKYDNLKCVRVINKDWMFIDRDYSLNNYFVAEHYNDRGFPVQCWLGSPVNFISGLYGPVIISYFCK